MQHVEEPGHSGMARDIRADPKAKASWPPEPQLPRFPPGSSSAPTREPRLPQPSSDVFRPRGEQNSASSKRTHPGRTNPRAVLWSLRPELWPRSHSICRASAGFPPHSVHTPWADQWWVDVREVSYSSYLCDGNGLLRLTSSQLERSLVAGW